MSLHRLIGVIGVTLLIGNAPVASAPLVPPRDPAATTTQQPAAPSAITAVVGTAFTYQGLLKSGGTPSQGAHDLTFKLYSDSTGGSQIGSDQVVLGVSVDNGFFNVPLDFGSSAFDGNARWLDIQVRVAGNPSYTQLLPRQALRPVPYATRAMNGPTGSSQWINDTYGIGYNGRVGIGGVSNQFAKASIDNGSANSQGLYVTSSNGPWAAFVVRNTGANGWGIYDDASSNHYLFGKLGMGTTTPGYPIDIFNTVGAGSRIVSEGTNLPGAYPGEGSKAALFVHGNTGTGTFGASSHGVFASSTDARAVTGWSQNFWGVDGNCISSGTYGVLGTPNEGVFGYSPTTSKPAAHFLAPTGGTAIVADGITKTKTLQIMGGADLAEPFDVSHAAGVAPEPGSVVVIDPANPGDLAVSESAYDSRVAGVISGAAGLAPGMVMQADAEHTQGDHPVALTGRVWCKVDASFGSVRPGDLLVTSPTPGHAMRANDAGRRAGAVLGKAMTALEAGRGLVLVLVSLQ
jgi:hypothetical protein